MFDTIRLDPPLKCPECGTEVAELQTHELGDTLAVYRLGSVITCSPILTGIVKETFYCDVCRKVDPPRPLIPIYIGIWHSVLVAVEFQVGEVEKRLATVDRLDLIGWIDQAQRQENAWMQGYHRLRNEISLYREHLQTPPDDQMGEEVARRTRMRRLWGLPDDVLNSADPLGAILKRNELDASEQSTAE